MPKSKQDLKSYKTSKFKNDNKSPAITFALAGNENLINDSRYSTAFRNTIRWIIQAATPFLNHTFHLTQMIIMPFITAALQIIFLVNMIKLLNILKKF